MTSLVKGVATINITSVDSSVPTGFTSSGEIVQFPGVGGGTRVAVTLVLTELFGIRPELATSFAFLLLIIIFVEMSPIGFGLALQERLGWQGLRQIGREATR
jgi:hypothetical protein